MPSIQSSMDMTVFFKTMLPVVAVWCYIREKFSIEAISIGVIVALLLFFNFFSPPGYSGLESATLLSGFAAPALITIMALLVVGQGMFQTGALEGPIMSINYALDRSPRRTLALVFAVAFGVSMFMNNTPVVVMFIRGFAWFFYAIWLWRRPRNCWSVLYCPCCPYIVTGAANS